MLFDPDNKVISLCAAGMELEGQGRLAEACTQFTEAWNSATSDFERFTAAHYVARAQKNASDKLRWDLIALSHALKVKHSAIEETLPSLYLNVGKGYEDLGDLPNAKENYELAYSFECFLPDDGYGNMIRAGIKKANERISFGSG